ncbi:hypothetical protein DNTS_009460 [Danionella cerebrum]|uniref:Osteocalcin-like C-terminal domain-containing protein n=1 Tax=Danionella cerebrum TaxID=2873325 RepID=A0A553PWT1_9TELE|nr:hypothetical protein DNTS_009460 [Danionella translucida]
MFFSSLLVSLSTLYLSVSLGADSQESHESLEGAECKEQSLVKELSLKSRPFHPSLEENLMLAERRAEVCEDFTPCRLFSLRAGSDLAYQIYFGAQQPRLRPHLRRY